MAEKSTWALVFGGLAVVLIAGYEEAKNPGPNGAAPGTPGTTLGPGSLIQQRPLPDLSTLSAGSLANYVSTFQSQLAGPLAFTGVTVNGNWSDPGTVAAVNRWFTSPDNVQAARAYNYGGGAGMYGDMAALMNAVDDQARNNSGGDVASDYRAPLAATAGLSGAMGYGSDEMGFLRRYGLSADRWRALSTAVRREWAIDRGLDVDAIDAAARQAFALRSPVDVGTEPVAVPAQRVVSTLDQRMRPRTAPLMRFARDLSTPQNLPPMPGTSGKT